MPVYKACNHPIQSIRAYYHIGYRTLSKAYGQSFRLSSSEAQLYLDTGGGDRPENVFGGMEHVKSQSWRAPLTRILVHIADAPDHGDFRNRGSSPRRRANSLLRHLKCNTRVYTYLFIINHFSHLQYK